MIERGRHDYLLFDGDCGICTYSADLARGIDRKHRFVVEPYQHFPEHELRSFGLTYEKCSKKVQIVTGSGNVYAGACAVNYFLFTHFPWSIIAVLVYLVPVLLLLEIVGYWIIAKNRHRISRWFGLKACLIKQ